MSKKIAPATDKFHPCACSRYEVLVNVREDKSGNLVWDAAYTTGCTRVTKRIFAQGHDARLKSFLIKHGAEGREIRHIVNGVATTMSAWQAAQTYGFSYMVHNGILAVQKRAERRAAKARASEKWPAVTAKVGRWTYEGHISADGAFVYTDKSGKARIATKFEATD